MKNSSSTPTYDDPHCDDNLHGEEVIMIHAEQKQLLYHYPVALRLLSCTLAFLFAYPVYFILVNPIQIILIFATVGPFLFIFIIPIEFFCIRITTVFIYITLFGITPKSCRAPNNTMFNIMFGCCCFNEAPRLKYTISNDNTNFHKIGVEMQMNSKFRFNKNSKKPNFD